MLNLQSMTEDDYVAYKAWMVEDYAADISHNYRIPIDQARENSARQIDALMNQGLATPNQLLYNIVISEGGGETRIGYLWIDVNNEKKQCFIYDVFLQEEYRHQGWGRKVLELLESSMKQQGVTRIGLHVFANNKIAQDFYRKIGYEFTGMNMAKWLVD